VKNAASILRRTVFVQAYFARVMCANPPLMQRVRRIDLDRSGRRAFSGESNEVKRIIL